MPTPRVYHLSLELIDQFGVVVEIHNVSFKTPLGDTYTFFRVAADSIRRAIQSPALGIHSARGDHEQAKAPLHIDSPLAPEPGTEFRLLDPTEDHLSDRWSKVKRVESEDRDQGIYEILDRSNRRLYLTLHPTQGWIQILLED